MKNLFEKHPVLYGIGATVVLFLVLHELAPWCLLMLHNVIPVPGVILRLILVALSIGACIVHQKMHEKEGYKGVFSFGKGKYVFIWLLIAVLTIHTASGVLTNFFTDPSKVALPTLSTICIALGAAAMEETIFRAIPIALMMYMVKDSKRLVAAMLISAMFFGCSHFYNIINGAALNITLVQVISCIGSGCIFAAIYLRTGSIIPCMIYHFAEDFFGTMMVSNSTGLMTITEVPFETYLGVVLMAIVGLCVGLFLLRKNKREEMFQTWAEKWGK